MSMHSSPGDLLLDCRPEQAAAVVTAALAGLGATGVAVQSPNAVQFQYQYKNLWRAGVLGAAMSGQVGLFGLNNAQSALKLEMKLNWGANKVYLALLAVGMVVFLGVVMSTLNQDGNDLTPAGLLLVGFIVIAMPAVILMRFAGTAKLAQVEVLDRLRRTLATPMPVAMAATPTSSMPGPTAPSAPVPPSAPASVEAGGAAGGTVFDKIKRLGELRAAGLITDADFDSQKIELLKRL